MFFVSREILFKMLTLLTPESLMQQSQIKEHLTQLKFAILTNLTSLFEVYLTNEAK